MEMSKSCDKSSSPLFCPEQNELKFVAWSKQYQRHPRNSEAGQSDGNSSGPLIFYYTAVKSSLGQPEVKPLFKSAWWHFQTSGPVEVLAEMD